MGLDTDTAQGRLILQVLGAVAEHDRAVMLERQREGVAKAKAEGKYKGRARTRWRRRAKSRRYCGEDGHDGAASAIPNLGEKFPRDGVPRKSERSHQCEDTWSRPMSWRAASALDFGT